MTTTTLKENPSRERLREMLRLHALYRLNEEDGVRGDFSYMNLEGASFTRGSLGGALFTGARLKGARFEEADLTSTIFDNAYLVGADFRKASARSASFVAANLTAANFYRADLHMSSFRNANLFAATLKQARLCSVNVEGASFKKASLTHTIVTGTNFSAAITDTPIYNFNVGPYLAVARKETLSVGGLTRSWEEWLNNYEALLIEEMSIGVRGYREIVRAREMMKLHYNLLHKEEGV